MKREQRLELLDDYVSGALDEAEATSFEEELFAAVGDEDAEADVRFFDRTSRMMAAFTAHGMFNGPTTEAHVRALEATGARVQRVTFPTSGEMPIDPVPDDVQFVVLRSPADLRGYEDVEVAVENADGSPVKTFRGVECDPSTGNIYAVCVAPLAKMAICTARRSWRITGVRDGKREVVSAFASTPR